MQKKFEDINNWELVYFKYNIKKNNSLYNKHDFCFINSNNIFKIKNILKQYLKLHSYDIDVYPYTLYKLVDSPTKHILRKYWASTYDDYNFNIIKGFTIGPVFGNKLTKNHNFDTYDYRFLACGLLSDEKCSDKQKYDESHVFEIKLFDVDSMSEIKSIEKLEKLFTDKESKNMKNNVIESGSQFSSIVGEGIKMGLATQGIDWAYDQAVDMLCLRFNISKEILKDPTNAELIKFAIASMSFMVSSVGNEYIPGSDIVKDGAGLIIKKKTADNTAMLMQVIGPIITGMAAKMNPTNNLRVPANVIPVNLIAQNSEKEQLQAELEQLQQRITKLSVSI